MTSLLHYNKMEAKVTCIECDATLEVRGRVSLIERVEADFIARHADCPPKGTE